MPKSLRAFISTSSSMRLSQEGIILVLVAVLVTGCIQCDGGGANGDEVRYPIPETRQVTERVGEGSSVAGFDYPDKPEQLVAELMQRTANASSEDPPPDPPAEPPATTWTRPLNPTSSGGGSDEVPEGREVVLRMNDEQVSIWRPSLRNPFVVAGGQYHHQAFDDSEAGQVRAPRLRLAREDTIDVIRRVPQTVRLNLEDGAGLGSLRGFKVQFEGYEGHYFVAAEPNSELLWVSEQERGQTSIGFLMDDVFPPGVVRDHEWVSKYDQPFAVQMTIWAVDRYRNVSLPVQQSLQVLPVGRGDLEVTLSMSLPSDLDLYVVEPNGNVIYYNNPRSWTNGQLDLDANAACQSNLNVRYEHIFWPEGSVPAGRYQIRVDNWANCVGGQAVDYQVIVQNCGDITIFEGLAEGPGGRRDCLSAHQSSCQVVANIDVVPCEN